MTPTALEAGRTAATSQQTKKNLAVGTESLSRANPVRR